MRTNFPTSYARQNPTLPVKEITVTPHKNGNTHSMLQEFQGTPLLRYSLNFVVEEPPEDNEAPDIDKGSVDFYSTKENIEEALKEMFFYVESTLVVDNQKNGKHRLIEACFDDITFSDIAAYLKLTAPEKKSYTLEELPMLEDIKYIYYQNLKWLDHMLGDNMRGWNIASGFNELKEIISTLTGIKIPEYKVDQESAIRGGLKDIGEIDGEQRNKTFSL